MQKLYSNERNNKQNAIVGFEQNRRDKKEKIKYSKSFLVKNYATNHTNIVLYDQTLIFSISSP